MLKYAQKKNNWTNEAVWNTFPNLEKLLLFGSRKGQLRDLVRSPVNIPANHAEPTYVREVLVGVDDAR